MSPRTVLSGEAKDTIQTQLNNLKDEIDQARQRLQQQYHDDNASIEQQVNNMLNYFRTWRCKMKSFGTLMCCFFLLGSLICSTGCSKGFWGGAALGTVGTGAAYEYNKKQQMEELEEDFEEGNIDKEEYQKRKKEIQEGSIIY